jgi:hypothetical protein
LIFKGLVGMKIIQLDALGKQGRYVRIQLLDKNYLSLAEGSTCHQAPRSSLVWVVLLFKNSPSVLPSTA